MAIPFAVIDVSYPRFTLPLPTSSTGVAVDAKSVSFRSYTRILKILRASTMPHSTTAPADTDAENVKIHPSSPDGARTEPLLLNLALDKIKGIHPSINLTLDELNIPPLKLPSKLANGLDRECLSLLSRKPPIVFRDTQLWCIGNLRSFQIAKNFLDSKDKIHCIELFNLSDPQIIDEFLIEFFYDPAVFGIHASDLAIMVEATRIAVKAGKLKSPNMAVEDYFGKLYCVDKRKFNAKNAQSDLATSPVVVEPAMPPEDAKTKESVCTPE